MSEQATHETLIKPRKGFSGLNFGELYKYRELLYFLSLRDIKIRYKQTILGASWAVLQPFTTMVVFTVIFGMMAGLPSEGIPYPIFAYSGLLLWTYFSKSVSSAGNSLVSNVNLVSKIYFPRLLISTSSTVSGLVDYVIALAILALMMVYYGFAPGVGIILLPYVVLVTFLLTNGLGYWFSALNVQYRDLRYVLEFFTQLLFFLTPVIYPTSLGGEKYAWIFLMNPMSGLVNAHRASVLGHVAIDSTALLVSSLISIAIFVTGIIYFKKVEGEFADVI
ncbi:ABC transporter permease [Candidatus Altiarchaeota archaeon]